MMFYTTVFGRDTHNMHVRNAFVNSVNKEKEYFMYSVRPNYSITQFASPFLPFILYKRGYYYRTSAVRGEVNGNKDPTRP